MRRIGIAYEHFSKSLGFKTMVFGRALGVNHYITSRLRFMSNLVFVNIDYTLPHPLTFIPFLTLHNLNRNVTTMFQFGNTIMIIL